MTSKGFESYDDWKTRVPEPEYCKCGGILEEDVCNDCGYSVPDPPDPYDEFMDEQGLE